MTMLMQSLSSKKPMQGAWGEYDESYNAHLIRGHGVADRSMVLSDQDSRLSRKPEGWARDGVGLNYELIVKPGVCTNAHSV